MMWIISLFLLAFTVDLGLCCSCWPEPNHIQNEYCSSSFVIRGKAIKRRERRSIELTTFPYPLELPITTVPDPWDMIKIFHVYVIEVFKAPTDANLKTGDVIEAVTNAHESMCGGYLHVNKELLITGGVNEQGQMTFGYCSYLKPYNVLSNFQLEGLQGGYSCDCRVATGYGYNVNTDSECRINVIPGLKDSECLHKYGRCVLEYNKCVWDVDPEVSCYYTTTSPSPRTTPRQPPRTTPPQSSRTTPPQSPRTTPPQ